ncbi:MAG: anaerobic sulfatase maturase [Anaerolineaceae bacterium]|nr:anaerobic sulfatase maturase [Anaerolineaceae bacterium]
MTSHPEKQVAPLAFHVMLKPRGPICNLDCGYCYYLAKEKLYPGSQFRMSDEVLAEFTRQYIEAQEVPEVTFAWQGGEPALMGLDFFQRAVALQQQYRKPGMRIDNAFQTNAVLLDEAWCRFFKRHRFLVGVSLDGPQDLHDAHRVDKGGGPTFQRVMAGLALLKKHAVDYNVLVCVHAANAGDPLRVYRFLRDEVGAQFMQFIPIVERERGGRSQKAIRVTGRSVTGRQYGDFLIAVFDEWVRHDVGRVFVQSFDVALAAWLGQPPSLCVFQETCGQAMAMEHNGDLYACDHFVEPAHRLGNIQDVPLVNMVRSARQRRFGEAKRKALPSVCQACPVRFACNGGCPKDRTLSMPGKQGRLNYLCEGYKAFFSHIDAPMQFMAAAIRARRPPSDIMRFLANHEK